MFVVQAATQKHLVIVILFVVQAAYFDRDDVALHGFAKFFRENSSEERDHAMEFQKYQNMRGGRVVFQDIAKPNNDEWGSPLEAIQAAFDLEKKVNLVSKTPHIAKPGEQG